MPKKEFEFCIFKELFVCLKLKTTAKLEGAIDELFTSETRKCFSLKLGQKLWSR